MAGRPPVFSEEWDDDIVETPPPYRHPSARPPLPHQYHAAHYNYGAFESASLRAPDAYRALSRGADDAYGVGSDAFQYDEFGLLMSTQQ